MSRKLEHLHEKGCCCQFNPSVDDSEITGARLSSACCPIHNYRAGECYSSKKICPYQNRGKL